MIFNKKNNINKDYLIKSFDYENSCYFFSKIIDGKKVQVNFNNLDRYSKKILLLENRKLKEDNSLYEKEVDNYFAKQRYKYLESIGFSCDCFEYLGKVNGTLSQDLENYFSKLLNDRNSLIGIHRVGKTINKNIINDIFANGLIVTGHFGGIINTPKMLSNTISYYPNNKTILKEMMYADSYKSSVGSIIIKIPDYKLEENNDILITIDSETRLNPIYIIGYVPLYENHNLKNIIMNQNYIDFNKNHKLNI